MSVTHGRPIVCVGAAVLIGSSFLRWWQAGGGPGELPARTDIGISNGPVLLAVLAALACLMLVTLPLAAEKPVALDRPLAYLGLWAVAIVGCGLRVAELVSREMAPWPPDRGPGLWLAALGLALMTAGVLRVFREARPRVVVDRP